MDLKDKIAVVTGAGRGMGRAISLQLAGAGAHIAVSDINADSVEETAVAVKALGRESLAVPADMGSTGDIDRMIAQAKDAFGRIDIMVNNAGVTRYIYLMDVSEEDWDRIHRVNAKGVFFGMQRAAREMIEQGDGGRIINIASIAGKGLLRHVQRGLRRQQGGGAGHDHDRRPPVGTAQHQRECHLPRLHPDRHGGGKHGSKGGEHRRDAGGAGPSAGRPYPYRPLQRTRGHRRHGPFPGRPRRPQHHRPSLQRRRRPGNALDSGLVDPWRPF